MQEITFEKLDALEAELAEAGEQLKESGSSPTAEQIEAFVKASVSVNMAKEALKETLRHEVVISEIGDLKLKARIEALLAENAKDAASELEDIWSPDGDAWDEIEDKAYDYVRSWVSPKETYLRYQLSKPVVSVTSLPNELLELVEEARRCFAMEQELSVIALGRMILECAMNDIGERAGLFSPRADEQNPYWDYPPSKRADGLFGKGSPRWRRFKRLYRQGSEVIHANRSADRPAPLTFLNEVLQFVSDEYAVHSSRFSTDSTS